MKLSHEGNAFLVIQRMVTAAKGLTMKDLNKPGTSELAKAGLLFLQVIGKKGGKKRAADADVTIAEEDWDWDKEIDGFVKIYAMVTAAKGFTMKDLNKPGTSELAKAGLLFLQKIGKKGGEMKAARRLEHLETSEKAIFAYRNFSGMNEVVPVLVSREMERVCLNDAYCDILGLKARNDHMQNANPSFIFRVRVERDAENNITSVEPFATAGPRLRDQTGLQERRTIAFDTDRPRRVICLICGDDVLLRSCCPLYMCNYCAGIE